MRLIVRTSDIMVTMVKRATICVAITVTIALTGFAQIDGEPADAAFIAWRNVPENHSLKWEEATGKYRVKLIAGGMKLAEAAKTISFISSRDEGAHYDSVQASPNPKFPISPNKLLIDSNNWKPTWAFPLPATTQ